jgi:hypothetical protein
MLESLSIHISKHPEGNEERKKFHSARIDHDFGCNSCMGHHAKSKKEFIKAKTESDYQAMNETNHKTFQRLKKKMLEIYAKYPAVNYAARVVKDAPTCRILF